MVPQVDILLATFNGEKYLRQQIQSIFLQSHQNFHLIIRDDGSTDATLKIVKEMITEFPQKVTLIEDKTHLGVIGSFCKLLSVSNACYIMFADQDDAWLSEKIAKSLAKMKDLEGLHGIEKPILVHSDLKVVDEKLELISPSYWAYTKIYPREGSHLNRLLVQNEITGCTVMINRSLANLSNPIFSGSVMHDWWFGLLAASFGYIGIIEEPLILYRQHGRNTLGAKKFGISLLMNRVKIEDKKRLQAEALFSGYQKQLSQKNSTMLQAYLGLRDASLFRNRYLMLKHRFFKQGLLRNLYTFLLVRVP